MEDQLIDIPFIDLLFKELAFKFQLNLSDISYLKELTLYQIRIKYLDKQYFLEKQRQIVGNIIKSYVGGLWYCEKTGLVVKSQIM